MATGAPRVPNTTLAELREDAGLSQHDLADELNALAASRHSKHPSITAKTVGRWERGEVQWPQPLYRRLLAEHFDRSAYTLGFHRPGRPQGEGDAPAGAPLLEHRDAGPEPRVVVDQQRWRDGRAALERHRRDLAVVAEGLYPDARVEGLEQTGGISRASWIPSEPIPLDQLDLELDSHSPEPLVRGGEPESASVRPLATADARYRRYHYAVRDLAAPRLFENRLCFRLTDIDLTATRPRLRFGQMGFVDAIDVNEAVAHETAMAHLADEGVLGRASWRRLAFRKLLGDPFDLSRRALMGALGTLTIRGGESPSVVLHQRDASRVAGGGGMLHLMPAAVFQPSSVLPAAVSDDFSLWRTIQREYAEELLGHDEYDGSGRPIRYDALEPFITMDRAPADGRIRVWVLGVVLDALTLAADILTVAVIDPALYDDLFADAVHSNAEGTVPLRRLPFEENTLAWLRETATLAPGAAAALALAWQHRRTVLRHAGAVAEAGSTST